MDLNKILLALGAVPGVLALIGAAMGYARLQQRLTEVEKDVAKVSDLSDKVTRIDQRTLNTERAVTEVKGDVARLVDHLITEPARLFRETRRARD